MVFLTTGVSIPLYCSILDVVQDSREDKDSLLTCYAALQSSGLSIYSHGISHLPQLHCMTITHFTSLHSQITTQTTWDGPPPPPSQHYHTTHHHPSNICSQRWPLRRVSCCLLRCEVSRSHNHTVPAHRVLGSCFLTWSSSPRCEVRLC